MKFKILTVLLCVSSLTFAATFTGDGFGHSHKEAKKESLADLSYAIKSEVKSTFKSMQDSRGAKSMEKILNVSSDLPIIGSEFTLTDYASGYKALSTLDTMKAKPLYEGKINSLRKEIDTLFAQVSNEAKTAQYRTYTEMLLLLDNYDRYRSVGFILGLKEMQEPKISSSEVKLKLASLSQSFSDLKQAIAFLTKGLATQNLYIFPPKADQSNEITPFAKVVKKHLAQNLVSTKSRGSSKALVKGNYLVDKEGMTLSLSVIDHEQKVLFSNVVRLDKEAFKSFEYKPKSIDFDKLLHEGYISKSSMKARIKTDAGDEDLLFVSGDSIKLFVKLNNPGYFYLVGHVDQKGKKFSYLLDLSETEGETKFVQYVDPEDANRWMMLGEFDVEAPFGIESMQLIASNKKIDTLPKHYYDEESGYHVLGKDPKEVAMATRGLKKKMSKKAQVSEAILMFTTMEK